MKQGLIGVIVPVYKVEKYIAECIESILAQTYTSFRLILVDDGSPDNAGKICDEYAKKDSRITVIHQENAGVTRARARGVEEANDCEFITFVDGDDRFEKEALAEMYGKITMDTDIVLCTVYFTEEGKCLYIGKHSHGEKKQEISDYRRDMLNFNGGMPWGRLFRRNIIDSFAFDVPRDIYYGEDAIMNLRIAFNTNNSIKIVDKPLYFYRQLSNGVCSRFTRTSEYEEKLRIYLKKSIPYNLFDEYVHSYIQHRLNLWRNEYNNCTKRPKWSNSVFHTQLKKEIREYHYNISFFDRLLLHQTNPIIRTIIILSRKAFNFLFTSQSN